MATLLPFAVPNRPESTRFEKDLTVSAYQPLVILALAQVAAVEANQPHAVAVRWLVDLSNAAAHLLRDIEPEHLEYARLYAEDAVRKMQQLPKEGSAS